MSTFPMNQRLATFPTIRRRLVAEMQRNHQGGRLLFDTDKVTGEKTADATIFVDGLSYPGTLGWTTIRIHVSILGHVTYELRQSTMGKREQIIHSFRGKTYPSTKYRMVFPVFTSLEDAIKAFIAGAPAKAVTT